MSTYVDYATPGLIVMAISYGLGSTATSVNVDMTKGIINRFKVMDVSRGARTDRARRRHAGAQPDRRSRPSSGSASRWGSARTASLLDWLGVIGLVRAARLRGRWLTVALGLAAKTVESAGMATVPLIMLPFLSSAFVPADTMGAGVRQFAEYQPFTPIIETLRGLLNGAPSAGDAFAALAWCVGIALVGYVWAVSTFRKRA